MPRHPIVSWSAYPIPRRQSYLGRRIPSPRHYLLSRPARSFDAAPQFLDPIRAVPPHESISVGGEGDNHSAQGGNHPLATSIRCDTSSRQPFGCIKIEIAISHSRRHNHCYVKTNLYSISIFISCASYYIAPAIIAVSPSAAHTTAHTSISPIKHLAGIIPYHINWHIIIAIPSYTTSTHTSPLIQHIFKFKTRSFISHNHKICRAWLTLTYS